MTYARTVSASAASAVTTAPLATYVRTVSAVADSVAYVLKSTPLTLTFTAAYTVTVSAIKAILQTVSATASSLASITTQFIQLVRGIFTDTDLTERDDEDRF